MKERSAGQRLGLLAALVLVAGCPASHGPYPGTSCQKASDCFAAEGEQCINQTCTVVPAESGRKDGARSADARIPDGGARDGKAHE